MLQSIFRSRGLLPLRTQYTNFFTSNRTFNSSAVCRSRPEPDRRLQMTFTCTANACGHRSSHEFSARAYNTGIVLLRCPHCKNRYVLSRFSHHQTPSSPSKTSNSRSCWLVQREHRKWQAQNRRRSLACPRRECTARTSRDRRGDRILRPRRERVVNGVLYYQLYRIYVIIPPASLHFHRVLWQVDLRNHSRIL